LNKAIGIIPNNAKVAEAAYAAASWGLFQIMGYHYAALGYESVTEFVGDMQLGERQQLEAFGRFLQANGLVSYLRNRQWAEFARRYNGADYAVNQYDVKLRDAYHKYTSLQSDSTPKVARELIKKGAKGILVTELQ